MNVKTPKRSADGREKCNLLEKASNCLPTLIISANAPSLPPAYNYTIPSVYQQVFYCASLLPRSHACGEMRAFRRFKNPSDTDPEEKTLWRDKSLSQAFYDSILKSCLITSNALTGSKVVGPCGLLAWMSSVGLSGCIMLELGLADSGFVCLGGGL